MKRAKEIAISIAVVWAALWILFGIARWGCLPTSEQCVLSFWRGFERLVLFLWVTDPEALISALLAVGAASVGAIFLNRQIRQANRHESRRLKRKNRAAKAVMPHTLSAVCDYATASARAYLALIAGSDARGGIRLNPENFGRPPTLASSHIAAMQAMIEASPSEVAQPIIHLLADLQVHETRWRGVANAAAGHDPTLYLASNFEGEICEAADIYAQATDMFGMVRPSDDAEPAQEGRTTLVTALLLMGVRGIDSIDRLAAAREVRRPASLVPGI